MSDPHVTPSPAIVTDNTARQIGVPVCDLCRSPEGPRDRQLLFGAEVMVLGARDSWAYVQAVLDGYVGYVREHELTDRHPATHRVTAPMTHIYRRADLKSRDLLALSHLSQFAVSAETDGFVEMSHGFVPKQHIAPISMAAKDPAGVGTHYLGTDYLWGGNSRWGIDCSGLVQAALTACDITCPGDSDQQMALGKAAVAPFRRNDLLFWNGHVALATDPDTIIHANAHAMAVTIENIEDVIARIANAGDGPLTAHRRLPSFPN